MPVALVACVVVVEVVSTDQREVIREHVLRVLGPTALEEVEDDLFADDLGDEDDWDLGDEGGGGFQLGGGGGLGAGGEAAGGGPSLLDDELGGGGGLGLGGGGGAGGGFQLGGGGGGGLRLNLNE